MTFRILRDLFYALMFLLCGAQVARATILVSMGDTTLTTGSSGYVPVSISSDSNEPLSSTAFEFRITTAGPTRLEFTDSPDPASDPTFSDAGYVFFGNSLFETLDLPLGFSTTTNVPGDTFIGGDATLDSSDVVVGTTNLLLVYLPVTTLTDLPPDVSDTFTVSLVPVDGDGSTGNTNFSDADFNNHDFNSVAGMVTITSVPEPGSWLLLVTGALMLATTKCLRPTMTRGQK